jgi:hypothetical protein
VTHGVASLGAYPVLVALARGMQRIDKPPGRRIVLASEEGEQWALFTTTGWGILN